MKRKINNDNTFINNLSIKYVYIFSLSWPPQNNLMLKNGMTKPIRHSIAILYCFVSGRNFAAV